MSAAALLPKIGQRQDGYIYAGLTTQPDGNVIALLLLDEKPANQLNFAEALSWAKGLQADLPTRPEAALLFANLRSELERTWNWTNETAEFDASYTCRCYFGTGSQSLTHKSAQGSARAVRRFVLQSFNPLVFA